MRALLLAAACSLGCGRGDPDDGGRPPGRAWSALGARDGGVAVDGGRPPSCADPVAGVWLAKTFAATITRWHVHRVTITRDAAGLHASQLTHVWDGSSSDALPGRCAEGWAWGEIEMAAELELRGTELRVWGTEIVREEAWCGTTVGTYHLDRFTGAVVGDLWESVNNDGNAALDRPYRFRRIACLDAP